MFLKTQVTTIKRTKKETREFEQQIVHPVLAGNPGARCTWQSPACDNCGVLRNIKEFDLTDLTVQDIVHSFECVEWRINNEKLEYPIILCSLWTDFFLPEAKNFLPKIGQIIKAHPTYIFHILTKRIEAVRDLLPNDGGDGYPNVVLAVTAENQEMADKRIPTLLDIPAKHRGINCTPMLGPIDLTPYLATKKITYVEASGEHVYFAYNSGLTVRDTYYEGFADLSEQCKTNQVRFIIERCGQRFVKDSKVIVKEREIGYRSRYAEQLGLNNRLALVFNLPSSEADGVLEEVKLI